MPRAKFGEMLEWFNRPVLKTGISARVSGVRIPLSPFEFMEQIVNLKDKIKKEEKVEKIERETENGKQAGENEKKETALIKSLIEWETLEYEYYPKSSDWYWGIAIIILALVFSVAYFFNNIILGILFFLLGFVILLYGAKKPRMMKFSLTYQGLVIGEKLYPYEHLKSFWLDYKPPERKELIVISKKTLMPKIIIPLAETDPNPIREFLVKILKEEYQEPSLSEEIARHLKF